MPQDRDKVRSRQLWSQLAVALISSRQRDSWQPASSPHDSQAVVSASLGLLTFRQLDRGEDEEEEANDASTRSRNRPDWAEVKVQGFPQHSIKVLLPRTVLLRRRRIKTRCGFLSDLHDTARIVPQG